MRTTRSMVGVNAMAHVASANRQHANWRRWHTGIALKYDEQAHHIDGTQFYPKDERHSFCLLDVPLELLRLHSYHFCYFLKGAPTLLRTPSSPMKINFIGVSFLYFSFQNVESTTH